MAISPQRLTIYLYSAHRAVIFAIAQLSCLSCRHSSDSIIPRSVVGLPFDSQQLWRTPLVESINLVYISPSNCPKVPSTRIRAAYTTSDWWKWRFLTSRSDCIRHVLQESIFEWLSAVLLTRPEDIRPRLLVIKPMTATIWTTQPRQTKAHEKLD